MQNNSHLSNLTIALAGIAQAATLVQSFAKTGQYEKDSFETSIGSIYHIDADTTLSIYGSPQKLSLGLQSLIDLFSKSFSKDRQDIPRYIISLLHLAKLLLKDKPMLKVLEKKLQYVISQTEFFHPYHETVIASLGHVYSETVGTYKFKIHVIGKPEILNIANNMDTVRSILLAGVRAAVLWHQLGGSQWQLLFYRKKFIACAKGLLLPSP